MSGSLFAASITGMIETKMRISKLIIAFTAILLTVSATAQTKDISLLAGVNVPMYKGTGTDAMLGVSYGQFFGNGLGFRTGVQWTQTVAEIDNSFGVPIAFAYRTPSRTAKERLRSGAAGARDAVEYWGPYGNAEDTSRGLLAGFLMNLISDVEFYAGVTPGYVAGSSTTASREAWGPNWEFRREVWMEKKTPLSLSLDAGMCINYSIWRFDIKLMPAFHYNLTDNYVRHSTLYDTMAGSQKEDVTPLRWFFTLNGGLAFRF